MPMALTFCCLQVQKLMFDPRRDSDALYHQFGIHLQNVMDLQLSEVRDVMLIQILRKIM
jgi:hypothetical protein